MKSKIASVILNSGLLIVVVTLIAAPLLMGQLLGEYESGALGVATTGSAISESGSDAMQNGIAVYPNMSDFTEYAAFAKEPVIGEKVYQTSVTFTAFSGQVAAYNSLFTLYNTSNTPLSVSIEGGKLSSPLPDSEIWLSIIPDGGVASTLVTEAAAANNKVINLAQTAGFNQGNIVVEGQVMEVASASPTSIALASPLKSALTVGQRVYFGPVYYGKSVSPTPSNSHIINLQPQQKATVNLSVATEPGDTATSQSVLPLVIRAN